MSVRETLAHRYVKRFYLARFISNFGNGMRPIALAFGILHLPHGSANELGLVLGSQIVAMLAVLPFGGVIADKFGAIKLCALSDVAAGLLLCVQAYYFSTGNVPVLALLISNIGFGLMWGIYWPAFSGALPSMLPEKFLQQGNALNQFLENFAVITGTAVGGYLISAFGSTSALFIDATTFIFSGLLTSGLTRLTPPRDGESKRIREDLKEGWRVFSSFRWVVATVAGFSFIVMAWAGSQDVLGPVIALKHFHGAKSWAIVLTFQSIGYVAGSILGIRARFKYPMRSLTFLTFTLTLYILVLSKPFPIWALAAAAFTWGIVLDLWGTVWGTAFQRTIPREALSRASAFDGLGTMALRPLGLAIAAPLAAAIGITATLLFFAGVTAITLIILLALPSVWKMELPAIFPENS
jgi:MFS family permease